MEKVKANEEFKRKYIFHHGYGSQQRILTADAFKLGASYYIMKPFTETAYSTN